ncbi:lipoprotein [Acidovorax sp. Be4]|uniref:Lipoprotein n=1 Tax=Acidovorax bellezanensis TaxID=2976702 RepID=A0ABT2PS41_9BURK|nr:lipoprotein [Acidovorax sp. Be4]MCT9813291.1 lipoprotein [Acidovorax sp. Be4]
MLIASQILVRTFALALCAASLAACGQRGPLFLPTAPEAAQRATLPETLRPQLGDEAPGVSTPAPAQPDAAAPQQPSSGR